MSLLDIARDTLKDLPVSDILRERLSLALDLAAQTELNHEDTKAQLARSDAHLERERLDHKQTQQELQRLQQIHAEEVRVERTIEFRRGTRTGGKWAAFCPRCHLPASFVDGHPPFCSDSDCHWTADVRSEEAQSILRQL